MHPNPRSESSSVQRITPVWLRYRHLLCGVFFILMWCAALPALAAAQPAAPDSPAMQALNAAPGWIDGMINDEPATMLSFWGYPEQAGKLRRTMLLMHWQAAQAASRASLPASIAAIQTQSLPQPALAELGTAYRQALEQALTPDLASLPSAAAVTRGMRWRMRIASKSPLTLAIHTGTQLRLQWTATEWLAQCASPPKHSAPETSVAIAANGNGMVDCELLQASGPVPAGTPRLQWQAPVWRDDLALRTAADQLSANPPRPTLNDRFFRCGDLGNCQSLPAAENTATAKPATAEPHPLAVDNTPPERPVPLREMQAANQTQPVLSLQGWLNVWLFCLLIVTWYARTAVPGTLVVLAGGLAASWNVWQYGMHMPRDSMAPWFILLLALGLGILTLLACFLYATAIAFWKQRFR